MTDICEVDASRITQNGKRFRIDPGDPETLIESLKSFGLLQPIGITPEFELIWGHRRLSAWRDILGNPTILARIVHVEDVLGAQIDENNARKDFSPSEKVDIVEHLRSYKHGGARKSDQSLPSDVDSEKLTISNATKRVGWGRDTYFRAKRVVEKGVPELVALMDSETIPISSAEKLSKQPPKVQLKIITNDLRTGKITEKRVKKLIHDLEKKERSAKFIDRDPDGSAISGIVTGDSLVWLREQKPESVDFFITDPPFGLGKEYDGWIETDDPTEYGEWLTPFWVEIQRVLKPGGLATAWQPYCHLQYLHSWFGYDIEITSLNYYARGQPNWSPLVQWVKPGEKPYIAVGKGDSIAWDSAEVKVDPYQSVHPCPRCPELCKQVIVRYSLPGSLVVDPFAGVGTIPLAAQIEGRKWVGIEQSAKYSEIARNRIAKHVPDGSVLCSKTTPW